MADKVKVWFDKEGDFLEMAGSGFGLAELRGDLGREQLVRRSRSSLALACQLLGRLLGGGDFAGA